MLCAVIGNGPRTGTTFVMRSLYEAGLPVVWNRTLNIPDAGFDLLPDDVFHVEHGIIKIWPPILKYVNIARGVVLRRNHDDQVRSINEQKVREKAAGVEIHKGDYEADWLIGTHQKALGKWLLSHRHTEIIDVRTEDLDQRIGEIIDWLAEPFLRRAA